MAAPETALQLQETASQPRLRSISVKNLRPIGNVPVRLELNNIVVLVGPNNAGKSTLLDAYELISTEKALNIEDFHNKDEKNKPEIVLEIVVTDAKKPGPEWIETKDGEMLVRERLIWERPGEKPERFGYLVTEKRYATKDDPEQKPWGVGSVAASARPKPHRIAAFANPEERAAEIIGLLNTVIQKRFESITKDESTDLGKAYSKIANEISAIRVDLLVDAKEAIERVEKEVSEEFSKVFEKHAIKFSSSPQFQPTFDPFPKNTTQLEISTGDSTGHKFALQGSGVQRTLLWTALRLLVKEEKQKPTAKGSKSKSKTAQEEGKQPNLLLIDEPEMCLDPIAIRAACNLLYETADVDDWQIILTTHSPIFIDVSKDHTTVMRVTRTGMEIGTEVYRSEKAKFSDEERELLKLMNLYDPYVGEFFFGGRTIIVEGDTEYSSFRHVAAANPERYKNVHIVRARGKATIAALLKIFNQFGSVVSVLHDSDLPRLNNGNKNPAWALNENIRSEFVLRPNSDGCRLLASLKNFEAAYLGTETRSDKPYHAISQLERNPAAFKRVSDLMDALIDPAKPVPSGATEWTSLENLEDSIRSAGISS